MALIVRGAEPKSVFGLRGADENSVTYALGWVLEKSLALRTLLLWRIFGEALEAEGCSISLQKSGLDGGYTDLEIQSGLRFHAVVEAKRGWELPTRAQLERYAPRISSDVKRGRIVSMSAVASDHAHRNLPSDVAGIRLAHVAWADLRRLVMTAMTSTRAVEERVWLKEFDSHLQEFVLMKRRLDSIVYLVPLSAEPMVQGRRHRWIDVVEQDRCYFHPIGGQFPVEPVNYVGFRYNGLVQSVHHVDSFKVVSNLAAENPQWLETDTDHFVYALGPPMRPATPMRLGNNLYAPGSHRVAIDCLLSGRYATVREAYDETRGRMQDE